MLEPLNITDIFNMLKARKLSKEELDANDIKYKGCTMLEPREWLDWAIEKKDPRTGGVVYFYDRLVLAFMESQQWDEDSAVSWVDYNTVRAIPYLPDPKPIIFYENYDDNE